MSNLKTPGVHVKEVSKLPTSVAQVETAIPAFIGYTEHSPAGVQGVPKRITSMLEYTKIFGGAKEEVLNITEDEKGGLSVVAPQVKFLMAYQIQMYFANGGGPCYIISLGAHYKTTPSGANSPLKVHENAIAALEKEDEPTLIVFTDATKVLSETNCYAIYSRALNHAELMKDRFVIMDTIKGDSKEYKVGTVTKSTVEHFRQNVASEKGLKYGAAYYPHVNSVVNYSFIEETADKNLKITHTIPASKFGLFVEETKAYEALSKRLTDSPSMATAEKEQIKAEAVALYKKIALQLETEPTTYFITDATTLTELPAKITSLIGFLKLPMTDANATIRKRGIANKYSLNEVKSSNGSFYARIKEAVSKAGIVLPPSAAMAGAYAKVDSSRGVWKAPANIGLNYVTGVTERIDNEEQKSLNVDETAGKSINAIRTFRGKGTLVWGARTLDGNSNEWRYVPVRRLFNMVEESVAKAADRYVFESNDANTWVRVKAMIENYLLGLWKDGALAGASPEDAFYVSIGLGETMDAQDVLNGRMNIEIGMAAVRPAEFIVLKFSHKLQES